MKKLFFTLLTLCLCGTTWAASHVPDITIPGVDGGNTYYFDIVSAEEGNYTVEITYNETYDIDPDDKDYNPNDESYTGKITDIPEKITYGGQEYTVIGIGEHAFQNCVNITELTIPGTIQYIGYEAIHWCDKLVTITIEVSGSETPVPLRIINKTPNESSAFFKTQVKELTVNRNITLEGTDNSIGNNQSLCNYNEYLQKVTIGGEATEICDYAFHKCTNLKDVTLSDGVTTIGERAFDECAITELIIPASVSSFGDYCFASCSSLASILLLAETKENGTLSEGATFSAIDFEDDANVTIYVPKGSAATYYASDWESIIVESESLTGFNFNFFSIDVDEKTKDTEEDPGSTCYWATYYIDEANYEVDVPDNCTLYTITDVSNGTISMQALSGDTIPAGTPLLVKTSASGANYFWRDYYDEEGVGFFSGENKPTAITVPNGSILYGHSSSGDTFAIKDEEQVTEGYYFYKLSLDSEGTAGSIGFYWGAEDGGKYTAGANRCWLAVPSSEVTGLNYLSFKKDNGDTTGISSVESAVESASVKGIYTIQGVRVSNMNQPGLYIVDGKKVLVK